METCKIKPGTNARLHGLLTKTGQMQHKAELVHGFTEGRTTSSTELLEYEALNLIGFLDQQFKEAGKPDKADRMRKKVLALCHTMGWYQRDANGQLVMKQGRAQLDYKRIDAFCTERGPYHKPLQQHTAAELTKLVTVFERLSKTP